MYKDYRSGQGDAVETIPGFRRVLEGRGTIYGIHVGLGRLFVHAGGMLYYVGDVDENKVATLRKTPEFICGLNQNRSISFCFNHSLYILDGTDYYRIYEAYYNRQTQSKEELYAKGISAELPDGVEIYIACNNVKDEAYLPTTHLSIDPAAQYDSIPDDYGKGKEHEQRNILNPMYKSTFVADGTVKTFKMKYGIQTSFAYGSEAKKYEDISAAQKARYPKDSIGGPKVEVRQYGVLLPWATSDGKIPQDTTSSGATKRFPNAIVTIWNDGTVELLNPPPAPENNSWDPTSEAFEVTDEQIENGNVPDNYQWSHAYPLGYAGIEITAKRDVRAMSGIEPSDGGATIITKCTIATIFDNRVFLSGNPEYPKHIFWSSITADGYPNPGYFGILNYDQAGISDAPVVAMLPVADTLMVLKRDSEGEGSVLFYTPYATGDNVNPKTYPNTQGLAGVGACGPCINFRDDPIFLSRFGVEAMGQLSVRYERAIEHRSSLIDAKLINCDLANASIAEWEGYLLVLCEGRVFMADSRQMFTHNSGVNQYEWYYLEDIGVFDGQFAEYVFKELPVEISKEDMLELTGGIEILSANAVRDEDGKLQSLIGQTANSASEQILSLETSEGKTVFYREMSERDALGRETGTVRRYYVEASGAMIGGEFDPAVMLKVIGGDIFFATRDGALCKFNFDMRDKETGALPNEAYDFDGRRIFSGIATKMDNCGIPHLTKNTVKHSTVIKTRTAIRSAAKVKVRTNKKAFRQVGRIINGRATFDDADFLDFSFSLDDKSIFSINEREKKWMEKQYFIYSDEFRMPFTIHYLAYRYNVAGQYKE
jgi:hypothetical protein